MFASALPARLDTMQAAILIEKLKIFEDEIAARNKVAERYARGLGNVVTVPRLADGCTSVWAQYTIRLPKGTDRDGFAAALKAQGIPTAIYYPKSMHQQTAYRNFPVADGGLPVSEKLSDDVISLPMHAYLDEPTQERIIKAVRGAWRLIERHASPSPAHRLKIMRKTGSDMIRRFEAPLHAVEAAACSVVSSPSAATRFFRG